MTYHNDNIKTTKMAINSKEEDVPAIFSVPNGADRKPRGYGEYTKKCDFNYHKIGLRK